MDKSKMVFVLMFPVIFNALAIVLIFFTDAYINAKILISLILGAAITAILAFNLFLLSEKKV